MEHRLHRAQWQNTQAIHHQRLHVKEYSDVFKGIGTLPGRPYHIRLKELYIPVQHPPKSVPVAMQSAYRAELNRLVKEGIITEVEEHTE